jgi:hypothetical protein
MLRVVTVVQQIMTEHMGAVSEQAKISTIIITLKAHALNQEKKLSLSSGHTSWDGFR